MEWVSGLVRVQPYEGTDIKLDEMSNVDISEEYALRYKIADGKLTVRFCKKHTWYGVDAAMLNLDEIIKPKELVVSVPRAMLESGEMDIQLTAYPMMRIFQAPGLVSWTQTAYRVI